MPNNTEKSIGEACVIVKPDLTEMKELLLALVAVIDEYEQKHD